MDLEEFFEFEPSFPGYTDHVVRTDAHQPLNLEAWDASASERGADKPRDRKRLEFAISRDFASIKLDDVTVVSLLEQLAVCAPKTKVARSVIDVCRKLRKAAQENRKDSFASLLRVLLKDIKVDPRNYKDPMIYYWDNQLVCLLSKYPFEGSDEVGDVAALEDLLSCERKNAETNAIWRTLDHTHPLYKQVEGVSRRIHELMGPAPSTQEVIDKGSWGPGVNAQFEFDYTRTGPEYKFASKPTLTPMIIPIASTVVASAPLWDQMINLVHGTQSRFRLVPGNEFFTVPKKFEVKRGACKEPMLNLWLQMGVESILLDRLLESDGVNLRTSAMFNQALAAVAAATGLFCTVDLRSASNNVCRAPVRSVISADWNALLVSLASEYGLLPEDLRRKMSDKTIPEQIKYEMLSSMGCGFTFLVETLLFRAIVTSVVPGVWSHCKTGSKLTWPHVAVFGDDLVFPTAYYHQVAELLSLFGFTINEDKTFHEGPFRESCGKDYHGVDMVRPLYISKRLDNGEAVVSLANKVLRHAFEGPTAPDKSGVCGDPRWRGVWHTLVNSVRRPIRKLITTEPNVPQGLWVPIGESTWETKLGRPPSYIVICSSPVKALLSEEQTVDHSDSPESQVYSLDRENLLLSRIMQIKGSAPSGVWPSEACMSSSGDSATLRHTVAYKPGIRLVTASCRWTYWKKESSS